MPGDILDLIDNALEDLAASTVELSAADGGFSCEWYAISRDDAGMPCAADPVLLSGPREWSMAIDFKVSPETRAAVSRMFHFDHPLPRRRYSRCPLCNPLGNPGRLAVDGREYARRRKARKRR